MSCRLALLEHVVAVGSAIREFVVAVVAVVAHSFSILTRAKVREAVPAEVDYRHLRL